RVAGGLGGVARLTAGAALGVGNGGANQALGEAEDRNGKRGQAVRDLGVQQGETQRALDDLGAQQRETEQALYDNLIALADREWWANNIAKVEETLKRCPGKLCGWEWHYQQRR